MGIFTKDPSLYDVKSYCFPAKVYFALASVTVLTAFLSFSFSLTFIVPFIFYLIWMVIWSVFLNWLCNIGLGGISWFLVFSPFILGLILITYLLYFTYQTQHQVVSNPYTEVPSWYPVTSSILNFFQSYPTSSPGMNTTKPIVTTKPIATSSGGGSGSCSAPIFPGAGQPNTNSYGFNLAYFDNIGVPNELGSQCVTFDGKNWKYK